MKITVTMKDPGTLYDAIREAVRENLASLEGISEEEKESLIEGRCERVGEIAARWFEYGEYLTVIIDTEQNTCTVEEVHS